MLINKKTLLFEELSREEVDELLLLTRAISRYGKIEWNAPLLDRWVKECELNETQKLIMVSTVFPAKAFDSIIAFLLEERKTARELLEAIVKDAKHNDGGDTRSPFVTQGHIRDSVKAPLIETARDFLFPAVNQGGSGHE